MARGDTLRKLFNSFSNENKEELCAIATQLIEEEKEKNHLLLAHDLERIMQKTISKQLASNNFYQEQYPEVPKDKETGLPLIEIQTYQFNWDRVVLSKKNLDILERIVIENRKVELLNSYNLKPTSKILFCGSSGCGKTITAKVLASVLEKPLIYVNLPSVFSSYLGETAVNLKKIFDYIKIGEWVVLFDEFDAIAKDRNSDNEHGEIKRLVNSLLQLIDNSQEDKSIFIAATNYESLLDKAIWRRFDEIIFFDKPDYKMRLSLLRKNLSSIKHSSLEFNKIASQLKDATGSEIEKICFDAIKLVILNNQDILTSKDLEIAVKNHFQRMNIINKSRQNEKYLDNIDDE
ncbi:AAA family ATPase [Geminocystis sp. NIES-3709]|uniref:AAA family ATPase n=1 Tax=Geminocystis sp. NIES-3709 TaxID=1617448 RepID=UPI0005FC9C21|nr:ATP-binding protein [Geminocystis sp. NIES-3709]BAQ63908.1 cell division protein FtsH [Geminocystis sp. NIES-3709]